MRKIRFWYTYVRDLWVRVSNGVLAISTVGGFAITLGVLAHEAAPDTTTKVAVLSFLVISGSVVSSSLLRGARYQFDYRPLKESYLWKITDPRAGDASLVSARTAVAMNDEVSIVTDSYHGDGDIHAGYSCGLGQVVGHYKANNEDYEITVIGLHRALKRGDLMEISTVRRMTGHFPTADEWIDFEIQRPVDTLQLSVAFPQGGNPIWQKVTLGNRTLVPEIELDGDGATVISITLDRPRVGRQVRIRWKWKADMDSTSGVPPGQETLGQVD